MKCLSRVKSNVNSYPGAAILGVPTINPGLVPMQSRQACERCEQLFMLGLEYIEPVTLEGLRLKSARIVGSFA